MGDSHRTDDDGSKGDAPVRAGAFASRVRLGLGMIAGMVLLSALVLWLADRREPPTTGETVAADTSAAIPARQVSDFEQAVRAAGCTMSSPPARGQEHVTEAVRYQDNPPASGDHSPEAALDGIFAAGNSPAPENWVHTLEHGRVVMQYKKGTPTETVGRLETLVSEELGFGRAGYLTALMENTTGLPQAVTAIAWTKVLSCPQINDGVFDAVRAFREQFTDRGPEAGIPPTN